MFLQDIPSPLIPLVQSAAEAIRAANPEQKQQVLQQEMGGITTEIHRVLGKGAVLTVRDPISHFLCAVRDEKVEENREGSNDSEEQVEPVAPPEEAFLQALKEHPDDDTLRLIFADWLEEREDARAKGLRLGKRTCTMEEMEEEAKKFPFLRSFSISDVPATQQGIERAVGNLKSFPLLFDAELTLNAKEMPNMQQLLSSGFFNSLGFSPHLRIRYPDGRLLLDWVQIGTYSAEELEKKIDEAVVGTKKEKISSSRYARSMMQNKAKFIDPVNARHAACKEAPETLDLICLRVRDLGFTEDPTTREIMGASDDVDDEGRPAPFTRGRITQFGFALCPPETGPYQRLSHVDQPMNDRYRIGMEPTAASDGVLGVFRLARCEDGGWLDSDWASPDGQWFLDDEILLRRCKSNA